MFREKIPARQLSAWLFTAMVPTLIQVTCGGSWAWLFGLGAVCILLNRLRFRWGSEEHIKWLPVPNFLLAVAVLGEMAAVSAGSWPKGGSFPAVPLILLALAAWSASKGTRAAARVGAVLFWFVIVMYLTVFAAGVKQVRWDWMRPTTEMIEPMGIVLMLVPSAAAFLPVERNGMWGKQIAGLMVAVAAVVLTQGVLSNVDVEHPFYEMSRSLELLGIAQRFEALICAAATVGWFALMALILSVANVIFSKWGVWLAAVGAAGWLLGGLHISGWLLAGGSAVFWVVLPILTQGLGKFKKS